MAVVSERTPYFRFNLIDFDVATWHDEANANWRVADALIGNYVALSNLQGVWLNSTVYSVGQRVVDGDDSSIWECLVSHTSAAAPTTFTEDRSSNPSYWEQIGAAALTAENEQYVRASRKYAHAALAALGSVRFFAEDAAAQAVLAEAEADAAEASKRRAVKAGNDAMAVLAQASSTLHNSIAIEQSVAEQLMMALSASSRGVAIAMDFARKAKASADLASLSVIAAETAEANAETAEANAETAEANAETAQAAAEAAQKVLAGVNTQTGTSYTLVLTDAGKIVEMNNASANTVTIPPNSDVDFPLYTVVEIVQYGAGQTSVAAGTGVTIRSANSLLSIRAQYGGVMLYQRAVDEWVMIGDLN